MSDRRLTQQRSAVRTGILAVVLLALTLPGSAWAQLRVLATDQTPLSLPSNIAAGGSDAYGPSGDYVFSDRSSGAVFIKRAGSSSIERLLQLGDPVPGMPHTRIATSGSFRFNASGLLCLAFEYFGPLTSGVILTYDGSTFHKIVAGSDVAPSPGGPVFGRSPGLVGMNDAGDIAFTAPLIPLGSPSGTPANTTLFIVPAGGTPTRIVGLGDALPDSGAATVTAISTAGFNNAGEALFRATLSTGGYGYYAGSVSGVRKIVAHGDTKPGGGTIDFSTTSASALLNNLGQAAFRAADNTVYRHTVADGLVVLYSLTTPVPAPLNTRSLTATGLSVFTDAGEILFIGTLSGTTANNSAIFRYTSGGPLDMVAYKGQAAAGTTGQTYSSLSSPQMNGAGDIAFASTLSPTTPATQGLFKRPAGGSVAAMALHGQASGLAGGGTFSSPSYSRLLADGSFYFESPIAGGTATYASFLTTSGGTQTLVTDLEPLPPGSRVIFSGIWMTGAGNYAGFTARRAGSNDALVVHNALTGLTSAVAAPGDAAPGGGTMTALSNTSAVYVNASGSVVFGASVSGTSGYVFVWDAANGIRKLAGPGDLEPSNSDVIKAATLTSGYLMPLANDAGQVAISTTFSSANGSGLYVAAPGLALVKVVRGNSSSPYGEAAPSGGTFSSFSRWLINSAGQVAFVAVTRLPSSTTSTGIYVWSPQSGAVQTVWASDPGSTVTVNLSAFDDTGRVVFFAPGADGTTSMYVGSGGTTRQAIALNGTAAPSGGNYAFASNAVDARVNVLGDIMFHAPLTGATSDSGYFLKRAGTGAIETVVLQGQAAPGTASTFSTIAKSINSYPGEYFALGPTGEALFNATVSPEGYAQSTIFRYRTNGVLERVIARGDPAPESGGGTFASFGNSPGSAGGAGVFYIRGAVVDGTTCSDVIYATPSAGAADNDVDGDGKGDVLWRYAATGDVWLWPMNGAVRTAETYVRTVGDTNWEIRGLGDQTGDGKADILWRNTITGAIYLWPMNGSTPLSETYVDAVDPAYDIVGTGDFNGDGKADILWRHLTNGEVWIWLMDGATPLSRVYVGTVDPAYVVKGVGDVDGDGKADIVWHHATAGEAWVWLMNGTTRLSATCVATVSDTGYQIAGVADFTGDGKADILWHHATAGEVWLWTMNGTTRLAETWVGTVSDTGYRIVGTGDYDGDGKADILWHHATAGEVWVWLMDGATRLSQTWVGTVPDTGYQIVKVK
jgi:hypothetical protein